MEDYMSQSIGGVQTPDPRLTYNTDIKTFEARQSTGQLKDSMTIVLLGGVLGALVAVVFSFVVPEYRFKPTIFEDTDECAPCNNSNCNKKSMVTHYLSYVLVGGVLGSVVFLTFTLIMLLVENAKNHRLAMKDRQNFSTKMNQALVKGK